MLIFWVYHNVPFSIPRTLCNFQGHDGGGLMVLVYQNKPECSFSQASVKTETFYSSLWKKRERRKRWGERERDKEGKERRRKERRGGREGERRERERGGERETRRRGKGGWREGRKMCPSGELTCPLNCSMAEMPLLIDQSSFNRFSCVRNIQGLCQLRFLLPIWWREQLIITNTHQTWMNYHPHNLQACWGHSILQTVPFL